VVSHNLTKLQGFIPAIFHLNYAGKLQPSKTKRVFKLAHPVIKNTHEQREVGVGNYSVEEQKLPLIFLIILDENKEFPVEAGNTPSEGIQAVIIVKAR